MNHSEAENHMLSVPALDMYYGGHMDSNASQAAMAATAPIPMNERRDMP